MTALPVNHSLHAVGFEIISGDGGRLFYTGDTGFGLSNVWEKISPKILIIDVTFPNRFKTMAEDSNHLCPEMLMEELVSFRKIRGYSPEVITIHMNPKMEATIAEEISEVSRKLDVPISIAHEGQEIEL